MLILTPSWVPRFPRNPLGGQNKHFTQLYNGLFDLVYFRISIIIQFNRMRLKCRHFYIKKAYFIISHLSNFQEWLIFGLLILESPG